MPDCPSFSLSCDNFNCSILYCCGRADPPPSDQKPTHQSPAPKVVTVPPHQEPMYKPPPTIPPPVKPTPHAPATEEVPLYKPPPTIPPTPVQPRVYLPPPPPIPPTPVQPKDYYDYEQPPPPKVPSRRTPQVEGMLSHVPSQTYPAWPQPPPAEVTPPAPTVPAYDPAPPRRGNTRTYARVPSSKPDGELLPVTQPSPATAAPPHYSVPYEAYHEQTPELDVAPRESQYPPAPRRRTDNPNPHMVMEYDLHAHQGSY